MVWYLVPDPLQTSRWLALLPAPNLLAGEEMVIQPKAIVYDCWGIFEILDWTLLGRSNRNLFFLCLWRWSKLERWGKRKRSLFIHSCLFMLLYTEKERHANSSTKKKTSDHLFGLSGKFWWEDWRLGGFHIILIRLCLSDKRESLYIHLPAC